MILGWYDKHADKTFKQEGSFYGKGDQTGRILGGIGEVLKPSPSVMVLLS